MYFFLCRCSEYFYAISEPVYLFKQTCKKWVHYACQNIDESDSKAWVKVPLGYICILCRCDDDGQLDFLMGTERLKQVRDHPIPTLSAH